MPELPEVETVKRVLAPHLIGRKITTIAVYNEKLIAHPTADQFISDITGQTITEFLRRGKYLTLLFKGGDRIVLHLRMTGCLTVMPKDTPCEKHTHLVFSLDDGSQLRYEDTRRFGKFWLFAENEEDTISGIHKLGVEPTAQNLTAEYLISKIGKSKKPIKEMLLDQSVIAGIGNIYSDEILFSAKIRPDRACNTLSREEWQTLRSCIVERLNYFIDVNSITFEDYMQGKGKKYRNTPYLQVYGKGGKTCSICGETLQSATIGGRSSVYCRCCQK